MSTYNQIAWFPLCAGLTGLGLVLSWFAFRRRGMRAGLRGVAWSLLPLAAYLTGAIEMIWKMGVAIGDFASSFVFSPEKWAGIAVTGLAIVIFVVSGMMRGRAGKPGKADKPAKEVKGRDGQAGAPAPKKSQAIASRSSRAPATADDDDFSEIEQILRNRGIS
jgi:hypothetical protein